MKLDEILNNRLTILYRQLNKINKIIQSNRNRFNEINENIELLSIFLEDSTYEENLRKYDTSIITDILISYHHLDDDSIEEKLKTIKKLLEGIYDRQLKISLNEEQKLVLKKYIDAVNELVSELKEKKASLNEEYNSISEDYYILEDLILKMSELLDRIKDKDDDSLLTIEDLEIIKVISEDKKVDPSIRKEVLIKYIEYNRDRMNGKSKVNIVDIKEIIKCFKEYGIDISYFVHKYEIEVANNANIGNIKNILEFMKSVEIIRKFSNADLLAICIFGNVDSVKETYEEINKKEDNGFYYSIPSVWIDNVEGKKIKKKRYKGQEKREKIKVSLNAVAHIISKKEVDKNIIYLNQEGFVFNPSDAGSKKTLIVDNYRLREAVNALKMYGIVTEENIKDFKIWILSEPQLLEKIDRFVELGLLGGEDNPQDLANYLKKYPAKIHNIDYSVYLMLYKMKQTYAVESYYATISPNRKGQLSNDLLSSGFRGSDNIEQYIKENFVDYNMLISNYELYESKINSSFDTKIDKSIFDLSEIEFLEKNNTIEGNPYVYVFDGLIISRYKVLRNYSLIHDGTHDSLISSIVYGSYLTHESIEKIAKFINYTLGGTDELSKKI